MANHLLYIYLSTIKSRNAEKWDILQCFLLHFQTVWRRSFSALSGLKIGAIFVVNDGKFSILGLFNFAWECSKKCWNYHKMPQLGTWNAINTQQFCSKSDIRILTWQIQKWMITKILAGISNCYKLKYKKYVSYYKLRVENRLVTHFSQTVGAKGSIFTALS